ncbi:hypothetical protein LINGRAHAP2_LOCUS31496 [Linum grandiflorum]
MEFGTAASGLLCWFHTTLLIRLWSYRGLTIYTVVRRYFDVSAPLFEPRSEEEFGARLSDMYEIVQSMRGLYLEYTGAP